MTEAALVTADVQVFMVAAQRVVAWTPEALMRMALRIHTDELFTTCNWHEPAGDPRTTNPLELSLKG